MATEVVIVVVTVAVVTVLAVAGVILQLVRRLRQVLTHLRAVEAELTPLLARLERRADVTGRELERVSEAVETLQHARERR